MNSRAVQQLEPSSRMICKSQMQSRKGGFSDNEPSILETEHHMQEPLSNIPATGIEGRSQPSPTFPVQSSSRSNPIPQSQQVPSMNTNFRAEESSSTSLTLPPRTLFLAHFVPRQHVPNVHANTSIEVSPQILTNPVLRNQYAPYAVQVLLHRSKHFEDCAPDLNHFLNVHHTSYFSLISNSGANCFIDLDEEHRGSDLKETRDWLADLCKEEQPKMDREAEYVLAAADRARLDPAMDTRCLKPIYMGLGPRPDEQASQTQIVKDMIAELRQPPKSPYVWFPEGDQEAGNGEARRVETYEELHTILQVWNRSVSVVEDHDAKLKNLLFALGEYEHILDDMRYRGRHGVGLFAHSAQLMQALCACWPETQEWKKTKKPYEIMVAIVANRRVAKPDIEDDNVWDAMFIVLLAELEKELPRSMLEEELQIQEMLEHPSIKGNEDLEQAWMKKDEDLFWKMATQLAIWLLDDLRAARKNLRQKVLGQLQALVMQQVGMREHLGYIGFQAVLELWLRDCEAADIESSRAICQKSEIWDAEIDIVCGQHTVMRNLNNSARTSVLKIQGREKKRNWVERQRIVEERKNKISTAGTMAGVVRDKEVVARLPILLVKRLSMIDEGLQAVLELKAHFFREYAEWLHRNVGSADDGRIWRLRLEPDEVHI